jgi:hypothetical protein
MLRGQVEPLHDILANLQLGLGVAVLAIALLLIAYFQSPGLALCALSSVPAVLAGVVVALLVTGDTLNLESYMGAITATGVAVANAILLVTYAERARLGGAGAMEAGWQGALSRLRPIVMTSVAMVAGMLPMALGIGESGGRLRRWAEPSLAAFCSPRWRPCSSSRWCLASSAPRRTGGRLRLIRMIRNRAWPIPQPTPMPTFFKKGRSKCNSLGESPSRFGPCRSVLVC